MDFSNESVETCETEFTKTAQKITTECGLRAGGALIARIIYSARHRGVPPLPEDLAKTSTTEEPSADMDHQNTPCLENSDRTTTQESADGPVLEKVPLRGPDKGRIPLLTAALSSHYQHCLRRDPSGRRAEQILYYVLYHDPTSLIDATTMNSLPQITQISDVQNDPSSVLETQAGVVKTDTLPTLSVLSTSHPAPASPTLKPEDASVKNTTDLEIGRKTMTKTKMSQTIPTPPIEQMESASRTSTSSRQTRPHRRGVINLVPHSQLDAGRPLPSTELIQPPSIRTDAGNTRSLRFLTLAAEIQQVFKSSFFDRVTEKKKND